MFPRRYPRSKRRGGRDQLKARAAYARISVNSATAVEVCLAHHQMAAVHPGCRLFAQFGAAAKGEKGLRMQKGFAFMESTSAVDRESDAVLTAEEPPRRAGCEDSLSARG